MSSHHPRSNGSWKALFVSPNNQLTLEMLPLVSHHPALSPASQLRSYPTPHELRENIAAHGANLCFLDISTEPERALKCLSDLLEIDRSLPVVALLNGNDSNLILRCLRQGATEFLAQPFTQDQLSAAMAKIARLNPGAAAKKARVFMVVPAKGASPNEEGLRNALRETLSSYKVPRRIVFITESEIPRTATGKLKLHELGELIASRG